MYVHRIRFISCLSSLCVRRGCRILQRSGGKHKPALPVLISRRDMPFSKSAIHARRYLEIHLSNTTGDPIDTYRHSPSGDAFDSGDGHRPNICLQALQPGMPCNSQTRDARRSSAGRNDRSNGRLALNMASNKVDTHVTPSTKKAPREPGRLDKSAIP